MTEGQKNRLVKFVGAPSYRECQRFIGLSWQSEALFFLLVLKMRLLFFST